MKSWCTEMIQTKALFFDEDFDVILGSETDDRALGQENDQKSTAEECTELTWDDGFSAGREAAIAESETDTRLILTAIADEMNRTRQEVVERSELLAEEIGSLLLGALRVCLPDLCTQYGAAEVRAIASEILPCLANEAQVRIQVAPDRLDTVRSVLSEFDDNVARNMSLYPSDKLGPSDIIIRWHSGESVRDASAIWPAIMTILALQGICPTATAAAIANKEIFDVK